MTALNIAVLCGSLQRPSRTLVLCEALLAKIGENRTIAPHVIEISQIGRRLGACLQRNELPADILEHLSAIEKADVVIVNPTHYAVALQWKRGSGRAPVCVAKGVDEVALRIRERARDHKVPIWPDPPAARAIHAGVKIGAEIEPEHFAAVAAAIRFAEAMRQKVQRGW